MLKAPQEQLIELSGDPEADTLLNDLGTYPHAFVLGCLMDRQIDYKKAWLIPYEIAQRMKERDRGDFSMENLSELSLEDVTTMMSNPAPLHHFFNNMTYLLFRYSADHQRVCGRRVAHLGRKTVKC